MEDIHKSMGPMENGTISNGVVANGNTNGTSAIGLTDKRLSLYGYTIESINMLLLPMIQNKFVIFYFIYKNYISKSSIHFILVMKTR